MFFLSLLPILAFIVLVIFTKIDLTKISLVFFGLTLGLGLLVWRIYFHIAAAATLKGIFIALDIFLIVFGALLFLKIINGRQILDQLRFYLEKISPDYRVQTILIAWFFESFIEGVTGFGTPITIAAPILVSLGLSPITAVSIALLGNSTAVAFGAAGTPIRVGFAGLDVAGIPFYSALLNLIGFIVPLFMLWLATRHQSDAKNDFLDVIPFAVFSGFCVVVPSFLVVFLGQEFPSIIGPIIGLILIILAIKFKLFLPSVTKTLRPTTAPTKLLPLKTVLFPYTLLIILLISAKLLFGNLGFSFNFGLNHTFTLFNPGLIFIITAIIISFVWHIQPKDFFVNSLDSFKTSTTSFLIIALISGVTQLMIHSHQNYSQLPSFLEIIASRFQTKFLPFITPFIGGFGSFMNGSGTISNLMFGSILHTVSSNLNFNQAIILSLQNTGAAAGNIISIADVLPALAILNLSSKTVSVLKMVIIPCLIYLFLLGITGMMII
jgi:lactate permease